MSLKRLSNARVQEATVLSLHDGTFAYENGTTGFAGDVAVLRC
eukprot:COSAG03_NODE_9768_length_694_cov_43.272269_2_plen_42_part_01